MIDVLIFAALVLLVVAAIGLGICTIGAALLSRDVSQDLERQKEDLEP
jgi:hypothetical protein